MYIACVKNNGKPYLNLSESYSINVSGVMKIRKRVIKNIGPLSRFDDGKPDFLQRLRKSFAEGRPLIGELVKYIMTAPTDRHVSIRLDRENESDCFSKPQNVGCFILDGLYDALGIYDVLNLHKSRSKLEYDLNGLAKLLVFGRVLWPDSKIGTFEERDRYLFGITSSEKPKERRREFLRRRSFVFWIFFRYFDILIYYA